MACNLNVQNPADHQHNNATPGVFYFSIPCRHVQGSRNCIWVWWS